MVKMHTMDARVWLHVQGLHEHINCGTPLGSAGRWQLHHNVLEPWQAAALTAPAGLDHR